MHITKDLRAMGYLVPDDNRNKWQKHSNEFVKHGTSATFNLRIQDEKVQVVLSNTRGSHAVKYIDT